MECYYAWNRDAETLRRSASGGIFAALGKLTIESGGAVFGACFQNDGFEVAHECAESMEGLQRMQGSKYAQSQIGNTYRDVDAMLRAGRRVLFSGTPCQIAALNNCLSLKRTDTGKLLTAELLCHGVTNKSVIRRYVSALEKRKNKRIAHLKFRTKKRPWYSKGSSMELTYEDGSVEIIEHLLDSFYAAYVNNLILRPSCYHCRFSRLDTRPADFTLGDFWGAEDYIQNRKALKEGIGLVLVNSSKAAMVWEHLLHEGSVTAEKLNIAHAIPRNGALVSPAEIHPMRQEFFERVYSEDFIALVGDYFGNMLKKNRIKNWIGYDNTKRLLSIKQRLRGGAR